jgi:sugar phosphate isomerase/epimerase
LRFGITPISFDNAMGEMTNSNGELNLLKFNYSNIVLEAIKRGYKHIELTFDLNYILPKGIRENDIKRLLEIKKEYNITYSIHFPLWSIEPSSPNRYIREASTDCLINAVELATPLEPEIYVLHATGALAAEFSRLELPEKYKKFITRMFAEFGIASVKRLIRESDLDPTKLAIETIEFPLEGTIQQIRENEGIKLCIDTGHVLAKYPGDHNLVEIIKKYWDITGEIHLHDGYNRFNKKQGKIIADHRPLGEGELPIEFLKFLHERDFQGPVVFELTFEEAKKSLEFIKDHIPEIKIDFVG